jgi:hypothetical protein
MRSSQFSARRAQSSVIIGALVFLVGLFLAPVDWIGLAIAVGIAVFSAWVLIRCEKEASPVIGSFLVLFCLFFGVKLTESVLHVSKADSFGYFLQFYGTAIACTFLVITVSKMRQARAQKS